MTVPSRPAPGVVLVVGDVIDDIVVLPQGRVRRGTDTTSVITAVPGGSGANQAAWLASQSAQVRFVGRVGADDAERHEAMLSAAGVDARLVADRDVVTGRIVIIVDPDDGERTMYTDRGANLRLSGADLSEDLLDGVGLLHVSADSLFDPSVRPAVLALVRSARRRGIAVSIDPASASFLEDAGPAALLEWVGEVTVLLPNLDEGRLLAARSPPAAIVEQLLAHAHVVALKLGPDGVVVAARDSSPRLLAAHPAQLVDTTGAGDAFAAGFLARLQAGDDVRAAAEVGLRVAAQAVQVAGARPALSR